MMSAHRFLLSTLAFLLAVTLVSCAGGRHFHAIPAEGPIVAPRYLDLGSDVSVATLHFPAGTYSLYATDSAGFYYRAPHKIAEHSDGIPIWHDGGIYVSKRNSGRLRGYVSWGGKLTHIGDFSRRRHEFRD
jgi:hypothetical protein